MIGVSTIGNATLIAYDEKPIISTDPWFGDTDPAYFGSWITSHVFPKNLQDDVFNSNIGIARSALYPQVNLTASKTELDEFSATVDELTNEEIQATVSWPIFTSSAFIYFLHIFFFFPAYSRDRPMNNYPAFVIFNHNS